MPREHNFLLGQGERLASPVEVSRGGRPKKPPYDFPTAQKRISSRLNAITKNISNLPPEACPGDEVVAVLTMHPRYVSKSDRPEVLLDAVGLRAIGSKARMVKPDQWGIARHPEEAMSEDLYIAGSRTAFTQWANSIPLWGEQTAGSEDLGHIENLVALEANGRIKYLPDIPEVTLEVVLHTESPVDVVPQFIIFAEQCGGEVLLGRRRDIGGLSFVPVRINRARVEELARFTFMRVVRGMPTIRPFRPGVLRSFGGSPIALPSQGPLNPAIQAVIFDGGLPQSTRAALTPWVQYTEPPGIGPSVPDYETHGLGVTTALLFGPIESGQPLSQPYCSVEHVRVIDARTGANRDLEYVDVLDRIIGHLDANPGRYALVNLSLGPISAVNDDEVTAWTALLDARFANGKSLVTVAVGNDGDQDDDAGLNRIQPPSDGVNVLSVGASDAPGAGWKRAPYSCVGPGRSPGLMKPDGVAFGGSDDQGFGILDARFALATEVGTSFAAPSTLRSGAAVFAQMGLAAMTPLTVRALMIHRAERDKKIHPVREVGWGLFELDGQRLITCDDNESLVIFQGALPLGQYLRAPVPLPGEELKGDLHITATLLIAPEVDPEHPSSYTRSGLEVYFRPHSQDFEIKDDGKTPDHAKTAAFFSKKQLYGAPEYVLRTDGHKWEPCLKNTKKFKHEQLYEPAFDIRYHHREGGQRAANPQPIPYSLIMSVKAPLMPDLYNAVVRTYSQILVPIRPQIQIQLRGTT